jgi:hypothetical protein
MKQEKELQNRRLNRSVTLFAIRETTFYFLEENLHDF